jgi:hypothetical protein
VEAAKARALFPAVGAYSSAIVKCDDVHGTVSNTWTAVRVVGMVERCACSRGVTIENVEPYSWGRGS